MEYPNRLYQLRNSLRKTQGDMAELLNISQSEYSRLEKGKRRLGVHEAPLRIFFTEEGVLSGSDSLVEETIAKEQFDTTYNNSQFDNHTHSGNLLLPVHGKPIIGGGIQWTERAIDMIDRVPSLKDNKEAYCVNVSGDDMKPRIYSGHKAIIVPTASCVNESVVLVEFAKHKGKRFFRELVKTDSERVVLKKYNPEVENRYKHSEIVTMHKVFSIRM